MTSFSEWVEIKENRFLDKLMSMGDDIQKIMDSWHEWSGKHGAHRAISMLQDEYHMSKPQILKILNKYDPHFMKDLVSRTFTDDPYDPSAAA